MNKKIITKVTNITRYITSFLIFVYLMWKPNFIFALITGISLLLINIIVCIIFLLSKNNNLDDIKEVKKNMIECIITLLIVSIIFIIFIILR